MPSPMIFSRVLVVGVLILGLVPSRVPASPVRFKAVAFDYFVLFNPDSVISVVEKEFPGKGREFTLLWRSKQFDYGFLRTITGRHADFFQVTADALVCTAKTMHLELNPAAKRRLLGAYLHLKPWPDTVESLRKLKVAGYRIITIANFTPEMLRSNAEGAGITGSFDILLSTEKNGTFKPDPAAYRLGMEALGLRKEDIVFVAFGGWDAYGAKSFGYTTYWLDRFGLPKEELGLDPDGASRDLAGLLEFLGVKPGSGARNLEAPHPNP